MQQYYNKTGIVEYIKPVVGVGLTFAEGDFWKRHRRIISNSFHYESLKSNVPLILKISREFFDKLSPEECQNYQVIHKLQQITGEVVGQVFVGESLNTYKIEGRPLTLYLADLLSEVMTNSLKPLSLALGPKLVHYLPSHKRLMKKVENFRQVCLQIVQDRKEQKDQHYDDLLGSLLKTQQSDVADEAMSDEDIINEFITFFAAGMDTTGHLIGMALYNLTQHPQYLQTLQQERDELFNKGVDLTADKLQKMDILHAFLKETLRIHTPIPLMLNRRAIKAHKLLDLDIPEGMLVKPDFFSTMFDEKHFENPYEFNPNRWRENTEKSDPYAYTPFSAGPRNCIGQHLAIMEAKIILSEFLERFDFKLKEGYKLKMTHRFLHEPYDELLFELHLKK
ncbi:MAG: cytochrome P450 [Flavobacterium sp.]|nr:MAG: cytochrome P450 [Flavobacterium sp.]